MNPIEFHITTSVTLVVDANTASIRVTEVGCEKLDDDALMTLCDAARAALIILKVPYDPVPSR